MQSKNEDHLYEHKTLMEVHFIAEAQITQSKRVSIQILDLMGEVGGFWEVMFAILGIFGNYMSSKLFQESLARTFYLRKKNDYEISKSKDDVELKELSVEKGKIETKNPKIDSMFERI